MLNLWTSLEGCSKNTVFWIGYNRQVEPGSLSLESKSMLTNLTWVSMPKRCPCPSTSLPQPRSKACTLPKIADTRAAEQIQYRYRGDNSLRCVQNCREYQWGWSVEKSFWQLAEGVIIGCYQLRNLFCSTEVVAAERFLFATFTIRTAGQLCSCVHSEEWSWG